MAKVIQVRRTKPQTGYEELIGDSGVVRQTLDPDGYVFIHGELWKARTEGGPIDVGETVRWSRSTTASRSSSRAPRPPWQSRGA